MSLVLRHGPVLGKRAPTGTSSVSPIGTARWGPVPASPPGSRRLTASRTLATRPVPSSNISRGLLKKVKRSSRGSPLVPHTRSWSPHAFMRPFGKLFLNCGRYKAVLPPCPLVDKTHRPTLSRRNARVRTHMHTPNTRVHTPTTKGSLSLSHSLSLSLSIALPASLPPYNSLSHMHTTAGLSAEGEVAP